MEVVLRRGEIDSKIFKKDSKIFKKGSYHHSPNGV